MMKMKYLWLVQIPAYKAFILELSWECKLQCVFVKLSQIITTAVSGPCLQ